MPASVQVVVGPALCGKTSQLLARYRTALARRRFGETLWLAPTQRSAFDIRGRLLGQGFEACLTPGVMTFAQFAESVLQASATPARPVTPAMKRGLVHRLIAEAVSAGRLNYFAPIAETPGLVDLVAQWIGELKRLEIWPDEFRRACRQRGLTAKDAELLDLYEAYQAALTKHELYDAEGRFWWARQLLRDGQQRPFERLRLAIVDGFTDFTRTQHEILEVLSQRIEELVISLPLEPETRREDLFAKARETLDELTRRHPQLKLQWSPRPDQPAWPALAHLEQQIFKNPREAELAAEAGGMRVLAASRDYGELVQIGRQIKQLLTVGSAASGGQPAKPQEVVVVFRRLAESAALAREVFAELGIPATFEVGEALDASPALAALVNLLELDREDWPFRRLLAVLGSSYFHPAWPEWDRGRRLAVAERVIRELQIPEGRAELLRRVRRQAERELAEDPAADADQRERSERRREEAGLALPLLERLAGCFDCLPQKAAPSVWVDALTKLVQETGFLKVMRTPIDAAHPSNEEPAWERLLQGLHAAEQLALWLGEEPPAWNRQQLLEAVLDILHGEQLPAAHDETGRVRVLSAASVRSLSVPYLFFAGLSETAMPGSDREDRLYSDGDYEQLRKLGLPLILHSQRNQEEMLLFYEVATRATRWLQLSYPALDEKAQPLLPSPYVSEVQRAMGPALEIEADSDLSPLPRGSSPQSPVDFRLLSVHQALAGDCRLLAALVRQPPTPRVGNQMLAALGVVGERSKAKGFGPYEGLLQGGAARRELAERFGPERLFSASHLELYASCPYRFFLSRVLRLRELPDVGLEIDFAQRGWRLHAVLARLHKKINQLEGKPLSPAFLKEAEFLLHANASLDELIALADDDHSLQRAMSEIDRSMLSLWLARYPEQHRQYDAAWKGIDAAPAPQYFEVSFGTSLQGEIDKLSREEPLVLTADSVTVKLTGRIDRIDVGQAGGRPIFTVVDYKSGQARSRPKDMQLDGTSLQLDLYTIATQELLLKKTGAQPWEAGYWYIKEKGYKAWFSAYETAEGRPKAFVDWESRRRDVEQKVAALVTGIRQAEFPVHSLDEHCTGQCPYHTVCRINQVRSLEKTWPEERS